MPRGIYKRTGEYRRKISEAISGLWQNPEYREKMSKAHEGNATWMKGKHHTAEAKRKMRECHQGQIPWNKGRTGVYSEDALGRMRKAHKGNKSHLGCKASDIARRRMSLAHLGQHPSEEQRRKIGDAQRGEKNCNWKGGITPTYERIRKGVDYILWRVAVFTRDNFICQKCGGRNGDHNAHHIRNFAEAIELRTSIENGITLCKKCHTEFHKIYGYTNNTREQIEEFLRGDKTKKVEDLDSKSKIK